MKICIDTLNGLWDAIIFDTDQIILISGDKDVNIIDSLFHNVKPEQISEIWMISGPAPFTSLRNISIVINTLQKFSAHHIEIFSISTGEFLQVVFPKTISLSLSAGKHEVFIFDNTDVKKYTKHKKKELNIEPLLIENISLEEKKKTWEYFFNKKNTYQVKEITPDYGTLPNIGKID